MWSVVYGNYKSKLYKHNVASGSAKAALHAGDTGFV